MSELKAFEGSPLKAFRGSLLKARGAPGSLGDASSWFELVDSSMTITAYNRRNSDHFILGTTVHNTENHVFATEGIETLLNGWFKSPGAMTSSSSWGSGTIEAGGTYNANDTYPSHAGWTEAPAPGLPANYTTYYIRPGSFFGLPSPPPSIGGAGNDVIVTFVEEGSENHGPGLVNPLGFVLYTFDPLWISSQPNKRIFLMVTLSTPFPEPAVNTHLVLLTAYTLTLRIHP